jgi:hypothetical protein
MSNDAAITIVSRNYMAFARTLAATYLQHHPATISSSCSSIVTDGLVPSGFRAGQKSIEVADLRIPDISRFIYR